MGKKKKIPSRRKKIPIGRTVKELCNIRNENLVKTSIDKEMKLYHGTRYENLESILQNGIMPRKETRIESTWDKFPSSEEMVYLAKHLFAFRFAYSCVGTYLPDGEEKSLSNPNLKDIAKGVVFEIPLKNLDHDKLYPDEDYIGQINNIDDTLRYRDTIDEHKEKWPECLHHLGNVAYRGTIGPDLITRYCIFDFYKRHWISEHVISETPIRLQENRIFESTYINFVKWAFGDVQEIAYKDFLREVFREMVYSMPVEKIRECQDEIRQVEIEEKDRSGITVVNLRTQYSQLKAG